MLGSISTGSYVGDRLLMIKLHSKATDVVTSRVRMPTLEYKEEEVDDMYEKNFRGGDQMERSYADLGRLECCCRQR